MSKIILCADGAEAIVDDLDFDFLSQYTWRIGTGGYVVTHQFYKKKIWTMLMHRVIMLARHKDMILDHRNGNKRDNRKANLRFCTRKQNRINTIKKAGDKRGRRPFSSKYLGVSKHTNGFFLANISYRGKVKYCGCFRSEEEAHIAVVAASLKYHGDFSPYHARMLYDRKGE